jgi:hypothetical protein
MVMVECFLILRVLAVDFGNVGRCRAGGMDWLDGRIDESNKRWVARAEGIVLGIQNGKY